MKRLLLSVCLLLLTITVSQAVNRIATVNTDNLFQQIAQKTGISTKLEREFTGRAKELQSIGDDLQNKIQILKRDSSTMKAKERSELEKAVISQRQLFSKKAQSFEQDRQRRSNEERDKISIYIQENVKKIAVAENFDLVIDTNAVIFSSNDIKDITKDVLKQVK